MITQGEGSGVGGGSTTNFCSTNPADQVGSIDNILSRLTAIETILSMLLGTDITAIQLSDISQDAGTLLAGIEGVLGSAVGYAPYAFQIGANAVDFSQSPSSPNNLLVLPGRTAVIPMFVPSRMNFAGVVARFSGAAVGDSSWKIDIYKENSSGVIERVIGCPQKDIFVPSYTTMPAKADPYASVLNPGTYYLLFRNMGAGSISLSAIDNSSTSGSSGGLFTLVRIGVFADDEEPVSFGGIAEADWYTKTVFIAMVGLSDSETMPFTAKPSILTNPYFEW